MALRAAYSGLSNKRPQINRRCEHCRLIVVASCLLDAPWYEVRARTVSLDKKVIISVEGQDGEALDMTAGLHKYHVLFAIYVAGGHGAFETIRWLLRYFLSRRCWLGGIGPKAAILTICAFPGRFLKEENEKVLRAVQKWGDKNDTVWADGS